MIIHRLDGVVVLADERLDVAVQRGAPVLLDVLEQDALWLVEDKREVALQERLCSNNATQMLTTNTSYLLHTAPWSNAY